MNNRKLGPNERRLLTYFAARVAIPPGGGMQAAISAIKNLGEVTRVALAEMDQAIAVIKAAPDNPYGDDNEIIAGAILLTLEKQDK